METCKFRGAKVYLHNYYKTELKYSASRPKIDIEEFRKGPIPGVYYIPNWITQGEEAAILERVYAVPDDNDIWVNLKHRRLQMWGGEVKVPFDPKPLPQWLMQISQALVDAGIFSEEKKPNHALINGERKELILVADWG
ncbi:unnamed protein product [Phytophthora fragariaefolia]|uniref:Unnamed protein product n=1 Tax=Phytophthora fragariaefolia TaxID=1490495 RepID=A0A9W6TLP1_9STRA|nr:unnamed protein product [Phytophthora fragariaefolia]